jgi:hypothetical protein
MANNDKEFFSGPNVVDNALAIKLNGAGAVQSYYDLGEMRAYDMWMTGTPTSDGGVAVVSTRLSPKYFNPGTLPLPSEALDESNPSGPDIQSCDPTCGVMTTAGSDWYKTLSTCSYVAKFDADLTLEWDKIWDSTDNAPRECFPGNLKQQECLYRIIESSVDGGLVICGNTSDNFDDGYIVKLYNDCSLQPFIPMGSPYGIDIVANFTTGTTVITGNETWNSPRKVLGKIYVAPGARLTIDNTTVEFAAYTNILSRIDVDLDGELFINNSTLTTIQGSDGLWRGMHAWGNPANHQSEISGYRDQGYIRIRGSHVENAVVALNNCENPGSGQNGGGIINVRNTQFLNNGRDAQFMKYSNFLPTNPSLKRKDFSNFVLCDFEVNDNYTGTPGAVSRVTMWDVYGVDYIGCQFLNTESLSSSSKRDNGILSSKAIFTVGSYCDGTIEVSTGNCTGTLTHSSFDGFYRGIEELPSGPNTPFYVYDATFDNNMVGIKGVNTVDVKFRGNTINVGDHPLPPTGLEEPYEVHSGIVLDLSQNYSVELNTLNGSGTQTTYGVAAVNSGESNNVIKSNDYSDMSFANLAYGQNRNNNSGIFGLDYYCNDNTGNTKDFYVDDDPSIVVLDNGISQYQGGLELETNNTFSSNNLPSSFQHFYIDLGAEDLDYYYGAGANEIPMDYTNAKIDIFSVNFTAVTDCADNGGDTPGEGFSEGKSGDDETALDIDVYKGLVDDYYALLDGGDTDELLMSIANFENGDDLFSTISLISPYLSKNALVGALNSNQLSSEQVQTVLISNPRLATSNEVKQILISTYDEGFAESLLQEAAGNIQFDPRTAMEHSIHRMGMELMELNKENLHAVYEDTTGFSLEALTETRMHLLDIPQYYSAVFAHWEMGNEEVWSMLSQLPQEFHLSENQEQEWMTMQVYLSFLDGLKQTEKEINQLDQEGIDELIAISETPNGGSASGWASNALCFHYGICKTGSGTPEPESAGRGYGETAEATTELNDAPKFQILPNPASQDAAVISIGSETTIGSISVYDMNGRRVLNQFGTASQRFDTGSLPNGVYFCRIFTSEGDVENIKFIVNH